MGWLVLIICCLILIIVLQKEEMDKLEVKMKKLEEQLKEDAQVVMMVLDQIIKSKGEYSEDMAVVAKIVNHMNVLQREIEGLSPYEGRKESLNEAKHG